MITYSIFLQESYQHFVPAVGWNETLRAIIERDPAYYDQVAARIVLEQDSQPASAFNDDLGPLIQNLCLLGAQHIHAGEDYTFRIWSYDREVHITLQGDQVQVEGEFSGTARYPAGELCRALLACAADAITFLKTAQANLPGSAPRAVEVLEMLYQQTQERLAGDNPVGN